MPGDDESLDEVSQLLAEFARWRSESRTADEAGARSRRTWLSQQSAESTTFSALALGWAERGAGVQVTTITGNVHHGSLRAVGRDFLLLSRTAGEPHLGAVLVATSGIAFICRSGREGFEVGPERRGTSAEQVRPDTIGQLGGLDQLDSGLDQLGSGEDLGAIEGFGGPERSPRPAIAPPLFDLWQALTELASNQPRLRVVTGAGPSVVGELRWVGVDVMCIRGDGRPPTPFYVRLETVAEVTLLGG